MTKTFKNTTWTRRNYDCTNIVACTANEAPAANWVECPAEILNNLTALHMVGDVRYFGFM